MPASVCQWTDDLTQHVSERLKSLFCSFGAQVVHDYCPSISSDRAYMVDRALPLACASVCSWNCFSRVKHFQRFVRLKLPVLVVAHVSHDSRYLQVGNL